LSRLREIRFLTPPNDIIVQTARIAEEKKRLLRRLRRTEVEVSCKRPEKEEE
jgi:hypothetical protein